MEGAVEKTTFNLGPQIPINKYTKQQNQKETHQTIVSKIFFSKLNGKNPNSDIILRPLDISDVDAAVEWYSDEKVSRFCSWDAFATKVAAVQYFLKNALTHPWHKAICVSGRVVGYVSVRPFHGTDRCRAELGYVVAPEHWGKGVATRAVKMAAAAVFAEWGHLERLEAVVDVENTASQRVVEKAGFVREGVLRKYYLLKGEARDAVIFSVLSSDVISSS